MKKQKVILVTDGDKTAEKAIDIASNKLGLEVVSQSAGNPTPCSGEELLKIAGDKTKDPVVLMFDDQGDLEYGVGEQALETVASSDEIELLGILAVASNSKDVEGISPECSITKEGQIINRPVTKNGDSEIDGHTILEGDTVDIINDFEGALVVGVGDIGKMDGLDSVEFGAPITTKALEEILKRSAKR